MDAIDSTIRPYEEFDSDNYGNDAYYDKYFSEDNEDDEYNDNNEDNDDINDTVFLNYGISNINCFINDAIESADNYYNSALINKHSRTIVSVTGIKALAPDLYVLNVSQKLNYPDSACLCLKSPLVNDDLFSDRYNRYISNRFFNIVEVDNNRFALTIEIKKELVNLFPNFRSEEIEIVSDLRFLIKKVREWYADYGHLIKTPPFPFLTENQVFVRGYESQAQNDAVSTALSSPISYIWGAPGTGKTQIVLANCIMSYIRQNKQVMILAPTNNAIEQTLRAVIRAMNEHNQGIDVLYRLGAASTDFAHNYPSICEKSDRQTKIEELRKQIEGMRVRLSKDERIAKMRSDYEQVKSIIEQIGENRIVRDNKLRDRDDLSRQLSVNDSKLYVLNNLLNNIEKKSAEITRRENSFLFKVKKVFDKSEEERLENEKQRIAEQRADYDRTAASLTNENGILRLSLDKTKQEIYDLESTIKKQTALAAEISARYIHRMETSPDMIEKDFSKVFEDYKDYEIDSALSDKIIEKELQLSQLMDSATESLKGRLVFALTVDYLHSHYKTLADVGINSALLSHVFLDEAAYCPLIKAGILFSLKAPVTFLGDHMQLPPICEASDRAIDNIETKIFLWSMSAIYFPAVFCEYEPLEALFEKHINKSLSIPGNVSVSALPDTFRFGNNLASILDEYVYKNGFTGRREFDTEIITVHAVRDNSDSERRANTAEAYAIKEFITKYKPTNYVVMTPYKVQRKILNTVLRGITKPDDILTVHASQGREWDTVILSVVDRSNPWFTDSTKPEGLCTMNTAISRAKKNIVIVCNCDYWAQKSDSQLIGKIVRSTI